MAPPQVQGARLRVPKGFEKILAVKLGFGTDQHGQDATTAALRAVHNALENSSLPALAWSVPGGFDNVKVRVKIGVPNSATVDKNQIKQAIPYGQVTVKVVPGGLRSHAGIVYPKSGDPQDKEEVEVDTSGDESEEKDSGHMARDEMFSAIASIRVGY